MFTPATTDQVLVKMYLNGKESAIEELITRHKDRVFTAIKIFVKDQYLAEDIFQETFIKAIDRLRRGKYKEEGKFLPWVLRIANNLCIDYYRKSKRNPKVTNQEGQDIFNVLKFEGETAEDKMVKEQAYAKVRNLIDLLPEEQREVVMLRHYYDFSFKEIAEMTNVSINTALGRMRYGLINLRKIVAEKEIVL